MVEQLLAHMSLEEKIGQMIQADIASITPAELRTYKLGSILAGGGAAPGNDIRSSPQAWLNMTDEYHRAALAAQVQGTTLFRFCSASTPCMGMRKWSAPRFFRTTSAWGPRTIRI